MIILSESDRLRSNHPSVYRVFVVLRERRRRRRVKLGHCASVLAPSSTTDWVSCNEEVANARAQNNLVQRLTQPVVLLYCHMISWCLLLKLVLFCIVCLTSNNPDNPMIHESESGQMVMKKVKLTWQTMWNHAKLDQVNVKIMAIFKIFGENQKCS